METRATLRGVRLSVDKGRLVADLIRGKKVDQALNILQFTPKRRLSSSRKFWSRPLPTQNTTTVRTSTNSKSKPFLWSRVQRSSVSRLALKVAVIASASPRAMCS